MDKEEVAKTFKCWNELEIIEAEGIESERRGKCSQCLGEYGSIEIRDGSDSAQRELFDRYSFTSRSFTSFSHFSHFSHFSRLSHFSHFSSHDHVSSATPAHLSAASTDFLRATPQSSRSTYSFASSESFSRRLRRCHATSSTLVLGYVLVGGYKSGIKWRCSVEESCSGALLVRILVSGL